jgi:ferritin-like metal-binding protein YciE
LIDGEFNNRRGRQEQHVAKKQKYLKDLFHDTLKDIYFAENKILKTLPKMAKAANDQGLQKAFQQHEKQTREHVTRLEKVFKIIGEKPKAKTCDAINGITDEGAEIMKEYKKSPALDAGLLAAAQAVEHYEISRYGTLKTWAEELGHADAVSLLDETLNEEKETDQKLTELAESAVNAEAEE